MNDLHISFSGRGKNKKATVHIKNECTINNVEELHNFLIKKIKNIIVDQVIIENVSNIDLAGLQLLISLRKELKLKNPDVDFQYNIDDELKKLITICGFNEINHN